MGSRPTSLIISPIGITTKKKTIAIKICDTTKPIGNTAAIQTTYIVRSHIGLNKPVTATIAAPTTIVVAQPVAAVRC